MKNLLAVVLGVVCVSGMAAEPLVKSELKHVQQIREAALKSSLGYDILESLTTEVGPRMAGTEGDARAVKWAVAKFKQLGFDSVKKEPVTFPVWNRGIEKAEVLAPYPQPLMITALGNSVGTGPKGLRGEIVHFETFKQLTEAEAGKVEGKIVFISYKMKKTRDGSDYGNAVAARSRGASEAAKKGAKAIVIRSIGTDSDRLPHTGMMRYAENVTKIPAAALSNPDADLLLNQLKRGKPVEIGLTMTAEQTAKQYTSYNVIGEIKGYEKPDEVVVIGGHLDSWDLGTGAVDDGAGVAITMAAAKIVSEIKRPRRTIRVILWANEEQGLHGAKAYAEAHKDELRQHITGSESDFGAGPIWSFDWRTDGKSAAFLDQMALMLKPLGVEKGSNRAWGGPDLSPLRRDGMSVFSLRQDGTDYFDLHHTANDTLDKVEPENMAQNVAVYAVFAYMTAQTKGDFGFNLK
ncbi:M20/M25/M40 family metallo-hydrolase [Pleionea sp. CnH1-48]|uniref:M20/M25/M40 family metallo-hydrolase n=1 Tax=Pleionea sp. CnH1-48 TaxID=2954494 RepID=UPI0020968B23|nr:M20/M25/M40 family metallo-hydrolase [Pleionea sp. CnH1-48]MCO7227227.1 M20/M25/M40 family metallo-hydrolase [Pleionea sp. CnH1-48]